MIQKNLWKICSIDFNKKHAPYLFISGSSDKSQPTILNNKNFDKYTDSQSKKTFKEFNDRTHNIILQKNW